MITIKQVLEAFEKILSHGLGRIRNASSLSLCQIEAYHLHNIPFFFLDPSRGPIHYYFTIERTGYLRELSGDEKLRAEHRYSEYWRVIGEYLEQNEQD